MKRILAITATLLLFASPSLAEGLRPEPTQNPDAPFRLFNTQNIYTLLKLDTRDGRIWQLQWGDADHRFIAPLNSQSVTSSGKAGRFTLYPTSNIYTFVLLDQETGDTWHVQWGQPEDRFMRRIKEVASEEVAPE